MHCAVRVRNRAFAANLQALAEFGQPVRRELWVHYLFGVKTTEIAHKNSGPVRSEQLPVLRAKHARDDRNKVSLRTVCAGHGHASEEKNYEGTQAAVAGNEAHHQATLRLRHREG